MTGLPPGSSAFFRLDGVQGGSRDARHPDWIEVSGFAFGAAAQESTSGGSGPTRSALGFDFALDRSLPPLLKKVASGANSLSGELELCNASRCYLHFSFKNILVQDVAFGPDRGEAIILFTGLTETYKAMDATGQTSTIEVAIDRDLRADSGLVTSLLPGAPKDASPTTNVFVRPAGIPGDSADKNHPGWISAVGSLLAVRNEMASGSSGAQAGKAVFDDALVEKLFDRASPKLLDALVRGQNLDPVELQSCPQTGGTCPLRIKLRPGKVSLLQQGPRRENVAFRFAAIEVVFEDSRGIASFSFDIAKQQVQ